MMKKVLFFTVMITSMAVSAQSWSKLAQIGVKGGVNLATVAGDDFESPDSRTSFYLGVLAELPVTERISLQPEVFYSGQGFDLTDEPNQRDAEFQIDYIQVPLIVKIYLLDGLNIQAGPQIGFKVNEEINFAPGDDSGDFNTDAIRDIDIQLATGLEYKFAESFFVQARYTYGISKVVEDFNVHNSVFSAGIGFMF